MNAFKNGSQLSINSRYAFTLVELLVVISIIAILATLLLSAIIRGKAQSRRMQCINNERQLTLAWTIYRDEDNDTLVANGVGDVGIGTKKTKLWVWGGNHNFVNGITNMDWLLNPDYALFASSIRTPAVYKCPEDRSYVPDPTNGVHVPRIRTYSLNGFLGSVEPSIVDTNHVNFLRGSDFATVSPAQIFLFQDLIPQHVCYPAYVTLYQDLIFHFPASHHSGAGVLSFVDGHIETHKWLDNRTRRVVAPGGVLNGHGLISANNDDLKWLQQHASIQKK